MTIQTLRYEFNGIKHTTVMQRYDSGQAEMIHKQCLSGQGQINPRVH